jgi:hypothetical protein
VNFCEIDYITVSLGLLKADYEALPREVLQLFVNILPGTYKDTCADARCYGGQTMRASQCGITVSRQYGSALRCGWLYSIQLSGAFWSAIQYDREAVKDVLGKFADWRISRLDLQRTVLVPVEEYRDFCKQEFEMGNFIIGAGDALTTTFGSRLSQFYARVYNKSAQDAKHFPAQGENVYVRLEFEIHRVKGELVLEKAFENPTFADRLYIQRVRRIAEKDGAGFLRKYYDSGVTFAKIRTVQRTVGDLEGTVEFVLKNYAPYIEAALKSKKMHDLYKLKGQCSTKAKKILTVLEHSRGDKKGREENG